MKVDVRGLDAIVATQLFVRDVGLTTSTVVAAWLNYTPGGISSSSILMARSTDGGAAVAPPISLSTINDIPYNFDLVFSGSTAIATWIGYSLPRGIFVARSIDGGATFGPPMNISNKSGVWNHLRISL